jgi:cell wall-associated NlpC family hydrolase
VTVDRFVEAVLAYRGVEFAIGGRSRAGLDCVGLVAMAARDVGLEIPGSMETYSWARRGVDLDEAFSAAGLRRLDAPEIAPGRIMVVRFGRPARNGPRPGTVGRRDHCAVAVAADTIASAYTGYGVSTGVWSGGYESRCIAAFDLPGVG